MTGLFHDVRYFVRQLRRNLGFTVVTVLTLALGIGANTGIFSVVEGVVLAPLRYFEPDRGNAALAHFSRWRRFGSKGSI
jgi:hypothetical protein